MIRRAILVILLTAPAVLAQKQESPAPSPAPKQAEWKFKAAKDWGTLSQDEKALIGMSPLALARPISGKEKSLFVDLKDPLRFDAGLVFDPKKKAPEVPDGFQRFDVQVGTTEKTRVWVGFIAPKDRIDQILESDTFKRFRESLTNVQITCPGWRCCDNETTCKKQCCK